MWWARKISKLIEDEEEWEEKENKKKENCAVSVRESDHRGKKCREEMKKKSFEELISLFF